MIVSGFAPAIHDDCPERADVFVASCVVRAPLAGRCGPVMTREWNGCRAKRRSACDGSRKF
jgi:hypothetical protein